jgi:metal-responsive CopG/Arc/MetJ family transcriptional regulator
MTQYTFSSKQELILQIDQIAKNTNRSRSETIVILLQQSVKERNRKRNAKSNNIQH